MIDRCPACDSELLEGFHALESQPTNSCLLLEREDEARAFPRGRLDLAVCRDCGFITNRAFEPRMAEYSSRYEETQTFSPTFVRFGRELAKSWVDRYDLHGKHILEIGCGKGEFLVWMLEAGAGSGTGIDPGVHPERHAEGETVGRAEWLQDRYDGRYAHLPADAIVCRHTLEHVSDVRDFLHTIWGHIEGSRTPVLFEVPDTQRVLDQVAFWDIYYEHCSYFTAGSLARTFRGCGFEVLGVELAFERQYLLLEAVPSTNAGEQLPTPALEDDLDRILAGVEHFRRGYDETVERWKARLAEVAARGGRAVLWGGGSKAVALLNTPGFDDAIAGVVDVNPYKQGRFVAGSGHEVLRPEQLRTVLPDLVVVANPVYTDEVAAELDALHISCEVRSL
jgi:hypothetical protein